MRSFLFLVQLIFVARVAGVNHKYPYIVYKTAPRDACALLSYSKFLYSVRSFSGSDASIADIFKKEVVEKYPNKAIFIFEDTKWTAMQIDEYSNRIANVFSKAGLRKGDVVALFMENRPEFVAIWLGLSKIGVVTALINSNLRHESLAHCVNIAKSSALIFDVDLLKAVKEVRDRLDGPVELYGWTGPKQVFPADETWAVPLAPVMAEVSTRIPRGVEKSGYNDKLVYIYTSGTTGLPKAAIITNSRYLFLAGAIRHQLGFKKSDRFYTPLPLYHTAGGAMAIGQALLYGSSVVIRKRFSARAYFADIVEHECTIAQYIGEMCRYILSTTPTPNDKRHNLRMIFGNGLRSTVWEEFVERFNIPRVGEFYGATEGNANVINTDNKVGAIGFISQICSSIYPVSVIKVDPETGEPIRDSKGLCVRCRPDEPGLIVGKITQSNPARAFPGYVDEGESEKKIVPDVLKRGDSAFVSGDIVVFDELGYLYFKDRIGDTFRWKGENVSTFQVETIVSGCTKSRVCVVYGVKIPDCEGRAGMAAIVVDDDDDDDPVNLETLAEDLREQLPSYAVPLFIRFLSHVDMTGTYKIKKGDLQKQGFDPETVTTDELFYMSSEGKYEPLTKEIYQDIVNGKIRF